MSHDKNKLTTERYIDKAKVIHGDRYDYNSTVYIGALNPITIQCRVHGPFVVPRASMHISPSAATGCQQCAHTVRTRGTTESFLIKARNRYGDRFDYADTMYVSLRKKLQVRCKLHGPFWIMPSSHLAGNGGCCHCSNRPYIDTASFIERARSIHGTRYDYSDVEYRSAREAVIVRCHKHGSYQVKPNEHVRKNRPAGCAKCIYEANTLTTEEFVQRAFELHGTAYDYGLVVYQRSDLPVTIICPTHGPFQQRPGNHLMGSGCVRCRAYISKSESAWLDHLGVAKSNRQVLISLPDGKRYKVDGYDPSTNTVFEFNGDYWHGNPAMYPPDAVNSRASNRTFGELWEHTQRKARHLERNGYTVISIWESEWLNMNR